MQSVLESARSLRVVAAVTFVLVSACELFAPAPRAPVAPAASAEPDSVASSVAPLAPPPDPAPPPSEPPAVEPPVEPGVHQDAGPRRGRLSKAAIQEGVEQGNAAYAACYQRSKRRRSGSVNVNFVIAPDGTVPYAAALEQGTTLEDPAVIDCVLEAFKKLVFPPPTGGRAVATYPLNFEPLAE
jgi:hypothetical protein